jgi:diguanylate cyclase (GGDEF)-like protein
MKAATRAADARELDVLLVEDSAADVELAIGQLTEGGFTCRHRVAATEATLRQALRDRVPLVILSDFTLPGFGGLAALAIASKECPDVPFIFLSGTMGEERAIEALQHGAIDYVLKSNPKRLVPAVTRALAEAKLRRASRRAERRVARLSSVLQMLSGINSAVLRIQDRSSLLNEACRLANSVGGYALTMIAMVDATTRTVLPVASAGLPGGGHGPPPLRVAHIESEDTSIMGRVIRGGQAVFCDDIAGSPLPISGREQLLAAGVRAIACVPLSVDETPVGAFFFGSNEAGLVGDDEVRLLREVAADLSFALQYLDRQNTAHFLTYFDPLTALAKRALFCERLGRLLGRGAERLPQLAVSVFDIHHLSVINDSFGRHTGDRLLQCVGDRLKTYCSDTDRLAHLGGGTFASFTALGADVEGEVQALRRSIVQLFDTPFVIEGHQIEIAVRCGIACFPQNGAEPGALVQNAEAALKEAKTSGEKYLHHRLEMNSALAERAGMEIRLRTALQNEEFVLHYQPKLEIRTGRIVGAEALLRWQDPERGLVAPIAFLSILETAGLMTAVSAWALKQAVTDCARWQTAGLQPIRVAVNIPPAELRRRGFVQEVLTAIGTLGERDPWGIDIEVTEGALHGDFSDCIHALRLLRTAGVRVAIDDFGTGYSSLARLSELPIDSLKIDRMFVSRLPGDSRAAKLVGTLIELAHAFGMSTIAEGVENAEQLACLARCGCDGWQGFLHSRAVPEPELALMLEVR